jgi:membrane protease YdiL (CAAX protease family)
MLSLILLFVPLASQLPYLKPIVSGAFPLAPLLAYAASSVAAVLVLMVMARRSGVSPAAFGCTVPTRRDLVLGPLGFLAGLLGAYRLAQMINRFLGTPMPFLFVNLQLSPFYALVGISSMVILGPLCEEILFRGFAIPRLMAAGLGAIPAGALSLLAFTAVHLAWGVGAATFILFWGTLPTALYILRRNIAASLTMHVLNNTFAFVVLPLLVSNH